MKDMDYINWYNDKRKINIIEKAGIKKPFDKLNVDLSPFTICKVSRINLLLNCAKAYYSGGALCFGKGDYELLKKGGFNKRIIHELAHHVHLDLCEAYLKSSDDDLVINSLDFLFNEYSDREGLHKELMRFSNVLPDLEFNDFTPKGFSKYLSGTRVPSIIKYYVFRNAAKPVLESFATYVSGDKALRTTAAGCSTINLAATLIHLGKFLLSLNPVSIGLAVFNCYILKKAYPYAQGVYNKWVKKYNDAERLALLAFPPRKKSETSKLLETLEEYSLILC